MVDHVEHYRYDGARQRYLVQELDPVTFDPVVGGDRWSDYDGDEVYGDFVINQGNAETVRSFEPGIGRVNVAMSAGDENTDYYHANHLGTTRQLSDPDGDTVAPAVYTAFGERISGAISGPEDRYGYVGAHGYQGHEAFAFLHVGARYYDPSIGRFLQRDPIGVRGGSNVYGYVHSRPTDSIDPLGLWTLGVGGNFTLHLGCIHIQFEVSVHIGWSRKDGHLSAGFSATRGGGVGAGAGGGFSGVITVTDADDVGDLGGTVTEIGADVSTPVGGFNGSVFTGPPGCGFDRAAGPCISGGQIGYSPPGLGVGGGVRAGDTKTGVVSVP